VGKDVIPLDTLVSHTWNLLSKVLLFLDGISCNLPLYNVP
jgi:hypothetical protein